MKTKVLGTGLSGLVGSALVANLSSDYEFENLDLTNGVDITKFDQVERAIAMSSAKLVIHAAAFTDVSSAQLQNGDKSGSAYIVNVIGTKNIARSCLKHSKFLIHLSTAYVFDGEKPTGYLETDPINPIEWYGQTKAYAEEAVATMGSNYAILRIDQPYSLVQYSLKLDIWHRIKTQLEEHRLPKMFTDHTFTPTNLEKFAQIVSFVFSNRPTGIFHSTTDKVTTDFEFAQAVKAYYKLPDEILEGSLSEFIKTANRPYQKNTALNCQKLTSLMANNFA